MQAEQSEHAAPVADAVLPVGAAGAVVGGDPRQRPRPRRAAPDQAGRCQELALRRAADAVVAVAAVRLAAAMGTSAAAAGAGVGVAALLATGAAGLALGVAAARALRVAPPLAPARPRARRASSAFLGGHCGWSWRWWWRRPWSGSDGAGRPGDHCPAWYRLVGAPLTRERAGLVVAAFRGEAVRVRRGLVARMKARRLRTAVSRKLPVVDGLVMYGRWPPSEGEPVVDLGSAGDDEPNHREICGVVLERETGGVRTTGSPSGVGPAPPPGVSGRGTRGQP
ncbi:MAG: hypothetical protein AVDCRST_MAG59-1352 [uncultured Thermomicrobiales bacterium]|uniref:Uncharacterized protein n=1 Tax=uncultured Thermomicrobiales bacterium TaxID=1645740 RepID=A0A6J4UDY8_9BACT|nr:MAG: hypothetical protein AVDCRST_MAG59-1352 [uncultured Thermomicrobiales bacterium]